MDTVIALTGRAIAATDSLVLIAQSMSAQTTARAMVSALSRLVGVTKLTWGRTVQY